MKRIIRNILKKIVISCIFSAFIFSAQNAWGSYKIVMPSGFTRMLDSRNINGIAYTTMRQLSVMIAHGGRYNPELFTLESRGLKLKTLPGSFFITLEEDGEMKIAQMLLPALLSKKELLLPVHTFFESLQTLGLYKVDIAGNTIRLKSDKYDTPLRTEPKPKIKQRVPREETEPDFDRIISKKKSAGTKIDDDSRLHRSNFDKTKKSGKQSEAEQGKESEKSESHEANAETKNNGKFREANKPVPPDKYVIPEKLKRDEVEKAYKKH